MLGLLAMAAAQNLFNGNALYRECIGNPVERIECQGYIQGVIGTADYLETAHMIGPTFCLPDGVVGDQIVEIVRNSLRDHPEMRQQSSAKLVLNALITAFPACPDRLRR